jgi:hypothetical protein
MKGHFQNKLVQRARFLFGGIFSPFSDAKKKGCDLSKGFFWEKFPQSCHILRGKTS